MPGQGGGRDRLRAEVARLSAEVDGLKADNRALARRLGALAVCWDEIFAAGVRQGRQPHLRSVPARQGGRAEPWSGTRATRLPGGHA